MRYRTILIIEEQGVQVRGEHSCTGWYAVGIRFDSRLVRVSLPFVWLDYSADKLRQSIPANEYGIAVAQPAPFLSLALDMVGSDVALCATMAAPWTYSRHPCLGITWTERLCHRNRYNIRIYALHRIVIVLA